MSETITIKNVNMQMLGQQKELLVKLIWNMPSDHMLWGLVHLLDHIQAEAKQCPPFTEGDIVRTIHGEIGRVVEECKKHFDLPAWRVDVNGTYYEEYEDELSLVQKRG